MFTSPRPTHASTITSGRPSGPNRTGSSSPRRLPLSSTDPSSTRLRTSTATWSLTRIVDVADPDPGIDHDGFVGDAVDVDVDAAERAVGDAQATGLLLADRHPALAERVGRVDAETGADARRVPDAREHHRRHDQPPAVTAQRADEQPEPAHDRRRAEPLLGMQPPTVGLVDERPDRGDDDRHAERRSSEDAGRPAREVWPRPLPSIDIVPGWHRRHRRRRDRRGER